MTCILPPSLSRRGLGVVVKLVSLKQIGYLPPQKSAKNTWPDADIDKLLRSARLLRLSEKKQQSNSPILNPLQLRASHLWFMMGNFVWAVELLNK